MNIKSQYKVFGPFGLLVFLNLIWGFLTYTILFAVLERDKGWVLANWGWLEIWILMGQAFFLGMLFTQAPVIRMSKAGIEFSYPIFFFIKKYYSWAEFDEACIVSEYSRQRTFEAVWLLKNGKLRKRISSAYYKNYHRMNASIRVPRNGRLKMNRWQQAWYLMGGRVHV